MPKIPLSDPVPVRLPQDVLADIEAVAETCDRSRSWVIVRALRLYLAREGADILAVRRGRQEAERGETHDLDDVLREIRAIASDEAA